MSLPMPNVLYDNSSPITHLSGKSFQFFDGGTIDDSVSASYYGSHGYSHIADHAQSSIPQNVRSKFERLFGFINPQCLEQFLLDFRAYQPQELELMQTLAASVQADMYGSTIHSHGLTNQNYIDYPQPRALYTSEYLPSYPVRPPSYATDPSSRRSTQSLSQVFQQSQRSSVHSSRSSWLPQTPVGGPPERDVDQSIWFSGYHNHPADARSSCHEQSASSGRRLADIQEIPNSCPTTVPSHLPEPCLIQSKQETCAQQYQPQLYNSPSHLINPSTEGYTDQALEQPRPIVGTDDQRFTQQRGVSFDAQTSRQKTTSQRSAIESNPSQVQKQYSQDGFGIVQPKSNDHLAQESFQPGPTSAFQQGAPDQLANGHPQLPVQEEYGLQLAVYPEPQPHLNHFQSSELPLMPATSTNTAHGSSPYQWTSSIHGSNDRASATPLPESTTAQRTHNFRHVKPQEEKPKLKAYVPCPDACGTMQTASELRKHVIAEHERSLKYHCNHCGWESFRREQWGRHRQKHEKHKRHLNQACTEACMSTLKSDDPPPRIRRACGVCFKLFDSFDTWFDHHLKHFSTEAAVQPTITLSGIMKGLLRHHAIKDLWRAEMGMHGWTWHGIEWHYQDEMFQKVRRALESDQFNGFNWANNDHGPQSLIDLLASCARTQSITILAPRKAQDEKTATTECFPSAGLAMETVSLLSSPRKLKKSPSQMLRTKQSLDAMSISEKSDVSMRSASRIPIRSGSTIRKPRPDENKTVVRSGRSQTLSSNSSL